MERILEPELMDDLAGAEAYAKSDWTIPHNAFVARFGSFFPAFHEGLVADLGCGTADPAIRFAKAYPDVRLHGLDGSSAMLSFGQLAVDNAGLTNRIQLRRVMLPGHGYPIETFDAIISNSLLHHLPNPRILWQSINELAKPEASIYVVDLTRPISPEHARALVTFHTTVDDPELMKQDFYNSLLAAFRPEEVRVQLDSMGLDHLRVEVVSDRHMVIHGLAK